MKTKQELPTIHLRSHGPGCSELAAYATGKVRTVLQHSPARVLFVRLTLDSAAAPRTATARVDVEVNGADVHARAAAPTLLEAVDLMQDRLRSRLARAGRH